MLNRAVQNGSKFLVLADLARFMSPLATGASRDSAVAARRPIGIQQGCRRGNNET